MVDPLLSQEMFRKLYSKRTTYLAYIWVLPCLFILPLFGQSPSNVSIAADIELTWSEAPKRLQRNLNDLNQRYATQKSSEGQHLFTYQIENPESSPFELIDLDGLYVGSISKRDHSHELELRLKPGVVIDFETLPDPKVLTLEIEVVAKSREDLARIYGEDQVDGLIEQQSTLSIPNSLGFQIHVADVDEKPLVLPPYRADSPQPGRVIQLKESDGPILIPISSLFSDPEGQPLYRKSNEEDVQIVEYLGLSPHFQETVRRVGDVDRDTNFQLGNSPQQDGQIVSVESIGDSYRITPVRGANEGIRKAEILIRGWTGSGPTLPDTKLDAAASDGLAKITVYVQTGANNLPSFRGATGLGASVNEGYITSIVPGNGTWAALDLDDHEVVHSLRGQSNTGACFNSILPGLDYMGTCLRMDPSGSHILVQGYLDYEAIQEDPVIRLTIEATDEFGGIVEIPLHITILDIDERVSGSLGTNTLGMHIEHQKTHRIDLSKVYVDPEGVEQILFHARSQHPDLVTAEIVDDTLLELNASAVGSASVNVWVDTKHGTLHETLAIDIRDTNNPPEFLTQNTSLVYLVSETEPPGSVLEQVIEAVDQDVTDRLTLTISPNRYFELQKFGLSEGQVHQAQLKVKSGLDYETVKQHNLELTVTDGIETTKIPVLVHVVDIDEPPYARHQLPSTVAIRVHQTLEINPSDYFVDEDTSDLRVNAYGVDAGLLEIVDKSNQLLTFKGISPGFLNLKLIAKDSKGQAALAELDVEVIETVPPSLKSAIPSKIVHTGLDEISLDGHFEDMDSDFYIAEATSGDDDLLWVFIPQDGSLNLITYGWSPGMTTVSVTVEDPQENSTTTTFDIAIAPSTAQASRRIETIEVIQGGTQTVALSEFTQIDTSSYSHLMPLVRYSDIVSVGVNESRSELVLTGSSPGETPIALITTSPDQTRRVLRMKVQVTSPAPSIDHVYEEVYLELGGEAKVVNLKTGFSHPSQLTYSVKAAQDDLVEIWIEDNSLSIRALAVGQTRLTVIATEPTGKQAAIEFPVVVSDSALTQVEQESLSAMSNALLSSVSTVISQRVKQPLRNRLQIEDQIELLHNPTSNPPTSIFASEELRSDVAVPTSTSILPNDRASFSNHTHESRGTVTNPFWDLDLQYQRNQLAWSFWSTTDQQTFSASTTQGRLHANYLGTELIVSDHLLIGIAGSSAEATSTYSYGTISGTLNTNQTLTVPYFQYQPNHSLNIWALIAQGRGKLISTQNNTKDRNETLQTRLTSLGTSYALFNHPLFDLSLQAEIGYAVATTQSHSSRSSLESSARQLSAGLSVSTNQHFQNWRMTPNLELNIRADEVNGTQDTGVEMIASTQLTRGIFSLNIQGRQLFQNADSTYEESGVSLSATIRPNLNGTGWSLTLMPSWGSVQPALDRNTPSYSSLTNLNQTASNSLIDSNDNNKALSWDLSHGWLIHHDRLLMVPFISEVTGTYGQRELGVRLNSAASISHQFKLQLSSRTQIRSTPSSINLPSEWLLTGTMTF